MFNERILPWFEQNLAEGLFLMKQPNVRWTSGFRGADTCVLLTAAGGFLITDPRYTEQAQLESPDFTLIDWREIGGSIPAAVAHIAREQRLARIAFEADALPYALWQQLTQQTDAQLVPTQDVVETLRTIKTAQELENLQAACDIACRAFDRILGDIRVGVTEKQISELLSYYMVSEGADAYPYGKIVISGPNTSLLHGIPGSRAVEYGDFVLMDYGCQFNGYLSDMTRTVLVGRATQEQREVYRLEQQMVADSLAVIKPGVPLSQVYEASVQAIWDTPYYPYHYRGIGHGIGLAVHESPYIRQETTTVFQPNMVTTIEPGLYIPGWGGVRIEEQIVITEDGCRDLVTAPSELIEL